MRAARAAVIGVGGDGAVGGVGADVLDDPVPRVGRVRPGQRRRGERGKGQEQKEADPAAEPFDNHRYALFYHQKPSGKKPPATTNPPRCELPQPPTV